MSNAFGTVIADRCVLHSCMQAQALHKPLKSCLPRKLLPLPACQNEWLQLLAWPVTFVTSSPPHIHPINSYFTPMRLRADLRQAVSLGNALLGADVPALEQVAQATRLAVSAPSRHNEGFVTVPSTVPKCSGELSRYASSPHERTSI